MRAFIECNNLTWTKEDAGRQLPMTWELTLIYIATCSSLFSPMQNYCIGNKESKEKSESMQSLRKPFGKDNRPAVEKPPAIVLLAVPLTITP